MEAYHNIDYYALYFRIGLLGMFLVQEGPEVLGGLETFFLLWLLVTMDAVPDDVTKAFLDQSTKLSDGDVNNFFEVIDTKDVISIVSEFFSYFWSSEAWTKRVETEKASQFVAAQVCSAYVCILSKFSDRFPRAEKKLEQYSLLLNESLTGLHGQLSDPLQIWDKALKDTPFTLAGTVYVKDYALIFPCKMKPMERRRDLGYVLEQVQNNLDKEFADSDLVALLERSLDSQEEFFVLIAPWYWVLTLDSKQFAPISRLLFILSCLATFNFTEAGVGFGFSWEPYVVPFGWAGILASLYFATGRRIPSVFPFPTIGAVGKKLSFDYGVVASRSSLISSIVQRACVLLFSSLLLFLVGFIFWGPSSYELTNVVDFKGYVLVPPDMFSYSSALTSLLQRASVATIQGEDGASKLAASPFAVAGLLGFNLMALTLVPGVHNDGGYLLNSLFRSKRLANQVKYACSVLVAISLCAKNPFLGLGWIAASSSFDVGCFVKDDVSDTDFIPTVSAALLLAAAIGCLIPFQ
ncbi:hypothetical protein KP509_13G084400 [Ceratopteris richardii]|nr:hypothetical protein KP509_13G084400 [Ceratopteris richardii]